jgi:hypothetical protein
MGTIVKREQISGKNLKEAFKALQDDSRDYYGHDIYSGGWNNCVGVKEVSKERFDEVDRTEDISKHENAVAYCVNKPVLNTNKIKTSVTNYPQKGKREWETRYVATGSGGIRVLNKPTQKEAIDEARKYVEKHPNESLTISIIKQLKTSDVVATINYKKSNTEKDGVWEVIGAMPY